MRTIEDPLTGEAPALGGLITCRQARSAPDIATHHAIRHQVFVVEQAVFTGSDLDAHDDEPAVLRILGRYDGAPAGSVRLFELAAGSGVWQGDRLAVLPPYRVRGVGAPLVRCAVAIAGAHGGTSMIAHIQLPNLMFFSRLGWRPQGEVETYAGRPHQRMVIGLPSEVDGTRTAQELFGGIRHG